MAGASDCRARRGAILSAALGGVSVVPMVLSIAWTAMDYTYWPLFALMTWVTCVVLSMIFGIRGLAAYRRACRAGGEQFRVTLLCSIAGIVLSVVTLCLFICGDIMLILGVFDRISSEYRELQYRLY